MDGLSDVCMITVRRIAQSWLRTDAVDLFSSKLNRESKLSSIVVLDSSSQYYGSFRAVSFRHPLLLLWDNNIHLKNHFLPLPSSSSSFFFLSNHQIIHIENTERFKFQKKNKKQRCHEGENPLVTKQRKST